MKTNALNGIHTLLTTSKCIFMWGSNNKLDHIDIPNELENKLKLFLSSENAGNKGYITKINSIIDELKEIKIIK